MPGANARRDEASSPEKREENVALLLYARKPKEAAICKAVMRRLVGGGPK